MGAVVLHSGQLGWDSNPLLVLVVIEHWQGISIQSWYEILHDSRKPNPVLIRPNDNSRCPNTGKSKNNDTITVMAILRAQAHPRGKDYCFLKSRGTPGSVFGICARTALVDYCFLTLCFSCVRFYQGIGVFLH
jgi:hypothetical protein